MVSFFLLWAIYQFLKNLFSVDATTNVKNCGGCAIGGFGTDCTKIANVDVSSVSCAQNLCVVEKCAAGFKPSDDDSSCVKA